MIVFATLLLFGLAGFFVPKRHMQAYMIIASIGISALYLFYSPPKNYDLFRHYEVLQIIKKNDIQTILFGSIKSNNYFVSEYSDGSRIYLLYLYLISQLNAERLLPFITGVIIYTASSRIIMMAVDDYGEEVEDWKISFCFFFLLIMLDFRTISGIRNMLTFSVAAYVMYLDLVRKKNVILCFIAYILLAGIHTSVYIIILLRILLLFKFIPFWGKLLIAVLSMSFLSVVVSILMRFSHVSIVSSIVYKISVYFFTEGRYYFISRVLVRAFLVLLYLLTYGYLKMNQYIPEVFSEYLEFFLIVVFLDIGAFRQYDTFVRLHIFLYCAVSPLLLTYLHSCVDEMPYKLIAADSSYSGIIETLLYAMLFSSIILVAMLYYQSYYPPMDSGFSFGI